jgi:hypothetical protein
MVKYAGINDEKKDQEHGTDAERKGEWDAAVINHSSINSLLNNFLNQLADPRDVLERLNLKEETFSFNIFTSFLRSVFGTLPI